MGERADRSEQLRDILQRRILDRTAKDIHDEVRDWLGQKRSVAGDKWIWELIQNARDVAFKEDKEEVTVEIGLDEDKLIFSHDAGPFTQEELISLIVGGSSKGEGDVGQFGRGFLSTHVVSPIVEVHGQLVEEVDEFTSFQITLDRSGDPEEIRESMEMVIDQIGTSKEEPPGTQGRRTTYAYDISEEAAAKQLVLESVEELVRTAPYVLAFLAREGLRVSVKTKIPGFDTSTDVLQVEDAGDDRSQGVKIEQATESGTKKITIVTIGERDDGFCIAFGVDPNSREIIPVEHLPRVFSRFPLFATDDLPLPMILNGPFEVGRQRSDLSYPDERKDELQNLLEELLGWVQHAFETAKEHHVRSPHQILRFGGVPESRDVDPDIWTAVLETVVKDLRSLKCVKLDDGRYVAPSEVVFPSPEVGDDRLMKGDYVEAINDLIRRAHGKAVASPIALEWVELVDSWQEAVSPLPIDTWGLPQLHKKIFDAPIKLNELDGSGRYALDDMKDQKEFIEKFLLAGKIWMEEKEQQPDFLTSKIIPTQRGRLDQEAVVVDNGVPARLKDISSRLDFDLRAKLADEDVLRDPAISDFAVEKMGLRAWTATDATSELVAHVTQVWDRKADDEEFRTAVADLVRFIWSYSQEEDLDVDGTWLSQLPVLTRDGKLRAPQGRFLLPEPMLDTREAEFADLLPDSAVLSARYAGTDEDDKETGLRRFLIDTGPAHATPIYWETKSLNREQVRTLAVEDKDLSDHGFEGDLEVASVLGFHDLISGIRGSGKLDRYIDLLEFILSYVAKEDDSWNTSTSINCSYEAHGDCTLEIYPSMWLAALRTSSWVPDESWNLNPPNRSNLRELFRMMGDQGSKVLQDPTSRTLLEYHFGLDQLEMTIDAVPGDMRDGVADLLGSLTDDPSDLEVVQETLERRHRARARAQRSHAFGERMEDLVQAVFKKHGFSVDPAWEGYDFDAYMDEVALGSDLGRMELDVPPEGHFYVEVKATTRSLVRMTRSQFEFASESGDQYILAVVEVDDEDADLDAMDLSQEENAQLRLVPLSERLGDLPDHFEALSAQREAGGIEVELGGDVRLVVREEIWRDHGSDIDEWVQSLLSGSGK